jgi:hypothetical protein
MARFLAIVLFASMGNFLYADAEVPVECQHLHDLTVLTIGCVASAGDSSGCTQGPVETSILVYCAEHADHREIDCVKDEIGAAAEECRTFAQEAEKNSADKYYALLALCSNNVPDTLKNWMSDKFKSTIAQACYELAQLKKPA